MSNINYIEKLAVGVIQTTLDRKLAWPKDANANSPKMSSSQDEHVWLELCKAIRTFQDGDLKPHIILMPELSLPRTRLTEFSHMVGALNVIAIAGAGYKINKKFNTVKNQGIIFVPRKFFEDLPSHSCTSIAFGKTYPAPTEHEELGELSPPWSFQGDDNVYVLDCEKYGKIGVSICYDFMDIERALIYRGRIQHLFVLAYNRDLGMFRSLAASLSRTVFCNVVICNTGYFGGSLAVAPYYDAFNRTLYEHNGQLLFTTQVVQLEVKGIIEAQKGNTHIGKKQIWKTPPPGWLKIDR
ncbi:MAG: carbon-nitrogen hydrolase family protein [bacterium]